MKKVFLFLMAALLLCACHKTKSAQVKPDNVINVSELISSDNADMTSRYDDYVWYETQILLNNFIDDEYAGVSEVTNIFQIVESEGDSYDTKVIRYTHNGTSDTREEIPGFWVEDCIIDTVAITFEHSLDIINQVNFAKPHSKHVVLRRELGPVINNAQWIYGNIQSQLYVDAVDGIVRDSSPSFPKENE